MSAGDDEREVPTASAPASAATTPSEKGGPRAEAVLGAKGRRALIGKLPPLGWQGGQILDAMKLGEGADLDKVLELTADDFLDPLWERVHGPGGAGGSKGGR